ncbi:metal-sensing transcriptional repressor [Paenibacillus sp. TRM 82003]|nr:metal-sensing transcriptional repressor [Paenibacillus sp. TRM 82003]
MEGRIQLLKSMVLDEKQCDEIFDEISVIQKTLYELRKDLFEDHLRGRIVQEIHQQDPEVVAVFIASVGKLIPY